MNGWNEMNIKKKKNSKDKYTRHNLFLSLSLARACVCANGFCFRCAILVFFLLLLFLFYSINNVFVFVFLLVLVNGLHIFRSLSLGKSILYSRRNTLTFSYAHLCSLNILYKFTSVISYFSVVIFFLLFSLYICFLF